MINDYDNYFKMRVNVRYCINSCKDRIFKKLISDKLTECIYWNSKTPYVKIFKERYHCRRFFYEFCIDDVPIGFDVIQICQQQNICVRLDHLRCVRHGKKQQPRTINTKLFDKPEQILTKLNLEDSDCDLLFSDKTDSDISLISSSTNSSPSESNDLNFSYGKIT